jgi:iron complex outermembrane receptor protein
VKGVEVSTEVASFGAYKARLTYGKKFSDKFDTMVSASHFASRGPGRLYIKEFDDPLTNNGVAVNADDESSTSFHASVSLDDFSAHATYGSREKGVPTGSFGTFFNDRRTRTTDRRGYVDLKYEHTFDNQVGLMARASYDSYAYDGTYVYDASENSTPQLAFNQDYLRGQWWSGELQVTKTLRKHRFTLGTEFRDNLRQDQGNYDLGVDVQYLDDRRKSKNVAVFLQDEFRISDNLTLSAGARYDHHSTFGGLTKPRVALIYHPAAKTTVKLLYGEAFRAPNNYERFFVSTTYKINPNLKPETITTSELVFEQYLGDHVRVSASGYVYRIEGLISLQTDPADGFVIFRNVERIASRGLEFEVEGKGAGGFEGDIAYTLQQTQNQESRQDLTNSPKHLGKVNLVAPILRQSVFTGFQLQYSSRRRTLNGTDLPAYFLSNLTVFSGKLAKGLDVSFGAYNLFNQKYSDPGSEEHRQNAIEQNGRNLAMKFTFHF